MRRIDEAIESLAPPKVAGTPLGALEAPMAFRWRGRRYVVDSVLAHWVETGAWWHHTERPDRAPQPADPERWLWRVEAGSKTTQTGVFDLCLEPDPPSGRWSLHAIYD
ncbi:MAG: DUF6504 family protein [Actinomycetes bacterium]